MSSSVLGHAHVAYTLRTQSGRCRYMCGYLTPWWGGHTPNPSIDTPHPASISSLASSASLKEPTKAIFYHTEVSFPKNNVCKIFRRTDNGLRVLWILHAQSLVAMEEASTPYEVRTQRPHAARSTPALGAGEAWRRHTHLMMGTDPVLGLRNKCHSMKWWIYDHCINAIAWNRGLWNENHCNAIVWNGGLWNENHWMPLHVNGGSWNETVAEWWILEWKPLHEMMDSGIKTVA